MLCLTFSNWSSRERGMKRLIRFRRFSMKPTVLTSRAAVDMRVRDAIRSGIRYAYTWHASMQSLQVLMWSPLTNS